MAPQRDDAAPPRPMLGRLVRELPVGDYLYEPKWDGFRCLVDRDGDDVELWSRHGRPLGRYFPEIVGAALELASADVLLDGELVVATGSGFDFAALMGRLHPAASRVEMLSRELPATFVAFDLLRAGGVALEDEPFAVRRERLERELAGAPPQLAPTPVTTNPGEARGWLGRYSGAGIDGVMAKPAQMRYEQGKRRMLKVKLERTAECVVAGLRVGPERDEVASLLLGLYGTQDELVHVGVVSALRRERRRAVLRELAPLAVPLDAHPWREGYLLGGGAMGRLAGAAGRWTPEMELDWLPLRPERVCEVAYEQVDGHRMRHPARFRRWRPDRDPASCRVEQLEQPAPASRSGPAGAGGA